MGRKQCKFRQTSEGSSAVIDLLLQMEPELKLLQGSITADKVEPLALASLAHNCDISFDRVMELWRASLIEARF